MATEKTEADDERGIDGTPAGQAARWAKEFKFARQKLEKWHLRAKRAVDAFLDKRDDREGWAETDSHLPVYTANIQTMRCIMYGKTPRVDVSRRFADSADDVARVSAEVLERLLNSDIQKDGDTYADAVGSSLDDRLTPGGGFARVRYVADLQETADEPEPNDLASFEAPIPPAGMEGEDGEQPEAGEAQEVAEPPVSKAYECVETDYVHWRDFLWDAGRTWANTRWVAFCSPVNREEAEKQFGPEVAAALPWDGGKTKGGKDDNKGEEKRSPWAQVKVWEVWSKEDRKRYFYCDGYREVLVPVGQDADEDGGVVDPYGLDGFFPCPKPMLSNVTTDDFVPVPDYYLAQDLYREINNLQTRIVELERVVCVRGIYDQSSPEIKALLTETGNMGNMLIPVSGLKMMMDGGNLANWVQWLPIDMVVAALDKLREVQAEKIAQVDQITGMSDIVRGEAAQQTTATEQSIKARFASVRIQTMQDEFARFCSDLQRLKAELISKHFDESTLLEAANMAYTTDSQDPQLIQQAVALIKSDHFAYRIEVKPESVSLTDYAALKSESMEVLQGIGGFIQMAAPLAQMSPGMAPMLLQLLQWSVSRIRGSQEIEGLLDRAISQQQQQAQQQAAQPQQPPPPDPKVVAAQTKAHADIMGQQMKTQGELATIHAQSKADMQHQASQTRFNLIEASEKERMKAVADVSRAINPPGTSGGGA